MAGHHLKVLAVFGTRPDAIKMAPVVLEFMKHPDKVRLVVAVTGQHREMLDQVLAAFEIKPDYDLAKMRDRQSLAGMTSRALEGLDPVIDEVKPDILLAQGDTTTTFVASLASFYHKVAFGHVEAGLRTDNKYNPFPEEMNRRLTAVLADLHFAPTTAAKDNLLAQGVPADRIFVTGNTVIDALLHVAAKDYVFEDERLQKAVSSGRKLILVTSHRRENWGEPMREICKAVKELVLAHPDVEVVFSLHKNPIVREVIVPELDSFERINLIEPPDYVPFVHLMKASHLILTDSGGVQEEGPALGKPVLVLRTTTERPEGVEAGNAKLVGTDRQKIVQEAGKLLLDSSEYDAMAKVANPYGDGFASERIVDAIFNHFGGKE
ncbi:MAG TPA: UDP-N-acetylglucosamine 2-epimerase (non-hydrolyzing) [Armatimonadota bacterium]|nr:UDP-N-acetylglucosamine 2-epimerase (non-hydrolyzing) [Armatimonadota bacterium]